MRPGVDRATIGPASAVALALVMAGVGLVATSLLGPTRAAIDWEGQRSVQAYAWSYGSALAATSSGPSSYLHVLFATDFVDGDFATDQGPYQGLYAARSSDGGSTWSAPARVSHADRHADRGALAADGSSLYAVWVRQRSYEAYDPGQPRPVFFRANPNHGDPAAWGPTVRLTTARARVDHPSVAASHGRVYVAWVNARTGALRLAVSADGGATWEAARIGAARARDRLEGHVGYPSLAASKENVGVAWIAGRRGAVKAMLSTDGGSTWRGPVKLAERGGRANAGTPSAAAQGDRLAFAWTTRRGLFARGWEAGAWGPRVKVAPFGPGLTSRGGYDAAVAFGPTGSLGLVWSNCRAGGCRTGSADARVVLSWSESTDDGLSWSHRRRVQGSRRFTQRINDGASVVWTRARARVVVYNGWASGYTSYGHFLRTGTGSA